MSSNHEPFLGELRLGRQYTATRQVIALGLVTFIGLFFLIASPVVSMIGNWGVYAAILAGLAFALTLLNILELLGGSGERGGTYMLIQETIGGLGAFLAGWSVLFASIAAGAALLVTAGSHLATLVGREENAPFRGAFPLAILVVLIGMQLLRLMPRRARSSTLAAILSILLIGVFLHEAEILPGVAPPNTLNRLLRAAGWLMACYAGFESILVSRRQIRNAGQRLPRALLGTLGAGIGLAAGTLLIAAQLPENRILAAIFRAPVLFPQPLVDLVVFLALSLAANSVLVTASRQVYLLSREGALPAGVRRRVTRLSMPVGLYALLAALAAPLILFAPPWAMVEMSAVLFLVVMSILNAAAIYSQRKEPERRRTILLPFFPLIPAVGIGLNIALLLALAANVLLAGVGLLGVGVAFYVLYARQHQAAAQEGAVVFGRVYGRRPKKGYRILVPLGEGDERQFILSIAISLAHQMKGEIIPLQVIQVADPLAIEEGRRVARERNTLFKWSTRAARNAGIPTYPITRLARSVPDGILETAAEEQCDLILLSWDVTARKSRGQLGAVLDPVIRRAPCDLAVLAYHPQSTRLKLETGQPVFQSKRLLVPTAGGPHAPLAARLALSLTREYDAVVQAVYVVPENAAEEVLHQGNERLQQTFTALREQEAYLRAGDAAAHGETPLEGQVVAASNVVEGIVQAGKNCDLILIGASEESLIDQVLFGTIPEQVAQQSETPVLMVKRFRGLRRFWLQRIWNVFYEALPKVSPPQQVVVYRRLQQGASPSVDYFVLMGLSTLIATFGLLQNSTAVIIGAMLVAPLFTPLMALSMAIVQGDVRLLRLGFESMLKGIVAAIGLAIFITVIFPTTPLTAEIIARTEPNLLDLGVALAAGVVGAYAVSREEVSAALPGVAIAAALVPPLGVVGIGLGIGDLSIAGGATLLVATNLIAIALAGAITLLLLGFRPAGVHSRLQLRRGLGTALVLFVLITSSLVGISVRSFRTSQTSQAIQQALQVALESYPELELTNLEEIRIQNRGDRLEITVPVYVHGEPQADVATVLSENLSQALDTTVWVRLVTLNVIEPGE